MTILEVCVDTPEGIITCNAGFVDRIELCSALSLGGLTPSHGLMTMAANFDVPAHAMIRPVPGGFELTDTVFDTMLMEIQSARKLGLAGVVFGVTTNEYRLDENRLSALIDAAGPMETTLHRAIDLCLDPLAAVKQAIDLGFTRILTSGAATTALIGRQMIKDMVTIANGEISIMAGSGVTSENLNKIISETGVVDVHASCSSNVSEDDRVVEMAFGPSARKITDAEKISAMRAALIGADR